MIDSHCHTFYSKHAEGSVNELVCKSIAAGIKVLTITDHAPFFVDINNRLLESELDRYLTDIDKAKQIFKGEITILSGLEMDFMPETEAYTSRLLQNYPVDFVLGSIHYVSVKNEPIYKVWELSRINEKAFLDGYFKSLELLIDCGLFDAVGHADSVLRGIQEDEFLTRAEPLLTSLSRSGMAYELNASGLRKTTLEVETGEELLGMWSYPSRKLMKTLLTVGVPFTVGSDAHKPTDAGAGIKRLIEALIPEGLQKISYFQKRQRIDVAIETLIFPNHV